MDDENTADTLALKRNLVTWLKLRNIRPEDIDDDDPLFEQGLGLDSLDAAVLVGYLDKLYGIKIGTPSEGRRAFASVRALAEFIGAGARPESNCNIHQLPEET